MNRVIDRRTACLFACAIAWGGTTAHAAEAPVLQLKIGRTSADTTAYVLAREVDIVFTNHLFSPEREQMASCCRARSTSRWSSAATPTAPLHRCSAARSTLPA